MSSEQLQSIFQVDSHELVPPYEVICLTHLGTSQHSISKRSINHQTSQQHLQNESPTNQIVGGKQQLHHVKKDLSKSAYYSELKQESNQQQLPQQHQPQQLLSTSINKLNTNKSQIKNINLSTSSGEVGDGSSDSIDDDGTVNEHTVTEGMQNVHKFDENLDDVIETDETKDASMQHTTIDLSDINEHNVSLSAFGEVYNLTLRPTEGLFKNGTQSLRMWSVATNTNATQGLEYDQIDNEVSVIPQYL